MNIVSIPLHGTLSVEEVLGSCLAFHLPLLQHFAVSGSLLLEVVLSRSVQVLCCVACACRRSNVHEMSLLDSVARWRLFHHFENWVMHILEELILGDFHSAVLKLRVDGSLGDKVLLHNSLSHFDV